METAQRGNNNTFPLESAVIHFSVADTKVSLWVLMVVGVATGYLARSRVGGFISGRPFYVFGVPTAVATGTETFLGTGRLWRLSYAYLGFVDLRLTCPFTLGPWWAFTSVCMGQVGQREVHPRGRRPDDSSVRGRITHLLVGYFEHGRPLDVSSIRPASLFAPHVISGALVILMQVVWQAIPARNPEDTAGDAGSDIDRVGQGGVF